MARITPKRKDGGSNQPAAGLPEIFIPAKDLKPYLKEGCLLLNTAV
jgi:hypothetical protein